MKKEEQLRIVILSYLISILGAFLINYFKVNNWNFYGSAVTVSSILTFWWWFYFKLGWKISLINKMLYRINLSGTWYGTYTSVSQDKKDDIHTGSILLRIKQDFLNISITSITEKYKSYSYSEELKYEEKSDTHGLIYVYSQKDKNLFDLNARNGTSDLKVLKYGDTYKLEGEFWTIFGTRGILEVVKISSIIVDSFVDGKKLYDQQNISKEKIK